VDQNESTARFREAIEIIDGLLRYETFTYHGQFWSFDDLKLTPRPVQRPRPPFYVGAIRTPESVDWLVKNDLLPLTGNPYLQPGVADRMNLQAAEGWIGSMILDAQRRYGKPETLDDTWGLLHNILVADTDAEAARIFRESWEFGNELMYTYTKIVEHGPLPDDYKAYAGGMAEYLKEYSYEDMLAAPGSLVGSPETVVEKITKVVELSGLKNHLMWMNRGGVVAQKHMLRSMELFATEVIPKVRHVGETPAHVVAAGLPS
jgi:alkanesulfonate monooxygenase SsuD/methylene tetrahydromethanopterin reductase-like flavin-dependent oxidoreductase (luciferase family)